MAKRMSLLRAGLSAALSLVLLLALAPSAFAKISWCDEDPVLNIGGRLVSVVVRVPEPNIQELDGGKVLIKVTVPENVDASLVLLTPFLNPDGSTADISVEQEVVFEESDDYNGKGSIPIRVELEISGIDEDEEFPVQLVVSQDGRSVQKTGESDGDVSVRFSVK